MSKAPANNPAPATTTATEDDDPIARIQARREARKAALRKARDIQHAIDLEALDALEVEHGDGAIASLSVDHGGSRWAEGLPTLVIVRCPTPAELKRYRARLKPKHEKDRPDAAAAAEEIASACKLYPAAEDYEKLQAARPGVHVQAGALCVRLAVGREEEEGKD